MQICPPQSIVSECYLLGYPGSNFKAERVLPNAPELNSFIKNQKDKYQLMHSHIIRVKY